MEFKDTFMAHYVPLCNYANSLLHNDLVSEDLVQDVFLHLWKNNNQLTINGTLQSFLFTSVKNKVFEYCRSKKAYKTALENWKEVDNAKDELSSESNKYMSLEGLSSLLRHLPPKCRNVFALHKLNGLSYAEIASKEGISIKTVENHMLKALKILRTEYAKGS